MLRSVHLIIREKLSAELARDGGLAPNTALVISGSLDLKVGVATASKIWLKLQHAVSKGLLAASDLQFKTHPNVDKRAWTEEQVIKLKDPSRGFPVGQGLGVLKWRLSTKDETMVPVSSEFLFPHMSRSEGAWQKDEGCGICWECLLIICVVVVPL